jgi:hypothetical protein
MDEQSHKDEMRAALRGDFERLRARRGGPEPLGAGELSTRSAVPPPAAPAGGEPVPGDVGRRGFVARVLGRS